jgi:hypothetical protein
LKLVSHYLLHNSKEIDSNVGTVTIISVKTPAPETDSNQTFAGPYGWDYPITYHIKVADNKGNNTSWIK